MYSTTFDDALQIIKDLAFRKPVVTIDDFYELLDDRNMLHPEGPVVTAVMREARAQNIIRPLTVWVDGLGEIPVFARPRKPSLHGKPSSVYQGVAAATCSSPQTREYQKAQKDARGFADDMAAFYDLVKGA